jgi:Helix-loop-helix DNA-binding domain
MTQIITLQPRPLTVSHPQGLPTPSPTSSSPDTQSSTESPREQRSTAATKRPHIIVEKRYRANLNQKIARLRDTIPSLHKEAKTRDSSEAGSDPNRLTPSNKLKKSSVLTNAVEYIQYLKFRVKRLEHDNQALKERLANLDKIIAQGDYDSQRVAAFTNVSVIEGKSPGSASEDDATPDKNRPSQPVQGLIPMPDSWRRLRQKTQEHYGHLGIYKPQEQRCESRRPQSWMDFLDFI